MIKSNCRWISLLSSLNAGDPSILVNEPFESKDRPQIIVPLCEMLQHAVPIEIPNSLSQFPVSAPPDKFKKPFDDSFANVYIHQIDEEFVVRCFDLFIGFFNDSNLYSLIF